MSLILGIESSCDETAAALVASDRRILAHCLAGQESAHSPYGGVVPEIAARAHVEAKFDARVQGERLADIYESLLDEDGDGRGPVNSVAKDSSPQPVSQPLSG